MPSEAGSSKYFLNVHFAEAIISNTERFMLLAEIPIYG